MLHVEEAVIAVGDDGVGLLTGSGGQLGAVISALSNTAKVEDNGVGVGISNVLSSGVGQLDLGDRTGQSGSIPEHRSIAVLVADLDAVAVVTQLDPLDIDTINGSLVCSVGLAGQTQGVDSELDTLFGSSRSAHGQHAQNHGQAQNYCKDFAKFLHNVFSSLFLQVSYLSHNFPINLPSFAKNCNPILSNFTEIVKQILS